MKPWIIYLIIFYCFIWWTMFLVGVYAGEQNPVHNVVQGTEL